MPESLVAEFEALALGAYEARVLLTLLHVESATSAELARHSGVPRTSIYQVVDSLTDRGLAQRIPSDGPARWSSPGPDEALDRMYRLAEERLCAQRVRLDRIRRIMDEAFPEASGPGTAYAQVFHGTAQVSGLYNHLIETVTSELLTMNRPPYSNAERVNSRILAALGRGVDHRILYQLDEWDSAEAPFRQIMDTYHAAGARAGCIVHVPFMMAVADREVALISINDPRQTDVGFPTTLLLEHPGFAVLQAIGFEGLWERSQPVRDTRPPP